MSNFTQDNATRAQPDNSTNYGEVAAAESNPTPRDPLQRQESGTPGMRIASTPGLFVHPQSPDYARNCYVRPDQTSAPQMLAPTSHQSSLVQAYGSAPGLYGYSHPRTGVDGHHIHHGPKPEIQSTVAANSSGHSTTNSTGSGHQYGEVARQHFLVLGENENKSDVSGVEHCSGGTGLQNYSHWRPPM